MGFNLGAFIVGASYKGTVEDLLVGIQPERYAAAGPISIREAAAREFLDPAVGVVNGVTLVMAQIWPYDCLFLEESLSNQEKRLVELSREAPIFCLLIDETSMSFGLEYFEGGERRRVRKVDPENIYADDGSPLPAESAFDPESHDDSQRIFAITGDLLGKSLDHLLFDNELTLTRYVEHAAAG